MCVPGVEAFLSCAHVCFRVLRIAGLESELWRDVKGHAWWPEAQSQIFSDNSKKKRGKKRIPPMAMEKQLTADLCWLKIQPDGKEVEENKSRNLNK